MNLLTKLNIPVADSATLHRKASNLSHALTLVPEQYDIETLRTFAKISHSVPDDAIVLMVMEKGVLA